MSNRKHTYTEGLAPRNTGSIRKPARFNLRLTCRQFGQIHNLIKRTRSTFKIAPEIPDCEVVTGFWFPIVDHVCRNVVWGSDLESNYCKGLARSLPVHDHLRQRAKRLAERGIR